VTPAVLAGVVLLPAPAGGGPTYTDPAGHYSLSLPDDWVEMDPDVLDTFADLARAAGNRRFYIAAGYQVRDKPIYDHPFIVVLVADHDAGGMSLKQAESSIRSSFFSQRPAGSRSGAVGRAVTEAVQFEPDRHRLVADGWTTNPIGQKTSTRTYVMIGRRKLVFLAGLVDAGRFDEAIPTFAAIAHSFRFGDGDAFSVASAPVRQTVVTRKAAPTIISVALFGVLAFVLGGATVVL
jgi:hypothetical protein